eukprot:GHVT01010233.1.p1 GENE.GHVT01010233.1~~GHVT01010233.1.p1  ORF type:complete len:440 (-),score=68.81 GHVT01010233.1:82-1401(-)
MAVLLTAEDGAAETTMERTEANERGESPDSSNTPTSRPHAQYGDDGNDSIGRTGKLGESSSGRAARLREEIPPTECLNSQAPLSSPAINQPDNDGNGQGGAADESAADTADGVMQVAEAAVASETAGAAVATGAAEVTGDAVAAGVAETASAAETGGAAGAAEAGVVAAAAAEGEGGNDNNVGDSIVGRGKSASDASGPSNVGGSNGSAGGDQFAECSICFNPPNHPVVTLCGHLFCRECIDHWLRSSRRCPVCNRGTERHQLITLFGRGALRAEQIASDTGTPGAEESAESPSQGLGPQAANGAAPPMSRVRTFFSTLPGGFVFARGVGASSFLQSLDSFSPANGFFLTAPRAPPVTSSGDGLGSGGTAAMDEVNSPPVDPMITPGVHASFSFQMGDRSPQELNISMSFIVVALAILFFLIFPSFFQPPDFFGSGKEL